MKKKFTIPLYNIYVFMYKDFDKFVKDTGVEFKEEEVLGLASGSSVYVKKYTIETIVHEALHVTFSCARHVGLKLENEEALCYMHEYIVDKMCKYYLEEK